MNNNSQATSGHSKLTLNFLIMFFISSSSFFVAILILFDSNKSNNYRFLFMLPLIFAIMNTIFANIYNEFNINYAMMILISVHYIRSVLSVLILYLADYKSVYAARLIPNMYNNMPKTILLLILELIAIYSAIYFAKRYKQKGKFHVLDINKKVDYFSIITFTLVLLAIVLWIALPQIRIQYYTIFENNIINLNIEDKVSYQGFIRIISTLGIVLIEMLKLFIPNYIIIMIRKIIGEKNFGILLSLPMILIQFMFITNTIFLSVIFSLVSIFLLIKIYPKNGKFVLIFLLFGLTFIIYVLFTNKLFNSTGIDKIQIVLLSDFIQAYFPGFQNLSGVFNISINNRIGSFVADIFYALPFKNSIASVIGYDQFYRFYSTTIYNSTNGIYSQIIPFVGQMYYYFGIFAPIFSGIIAYKSVKIGYEIEKISNVWIYVLKVYILIILSVSTALYNMSIMLTLLITPGVFYWILVNLQSKYNKGIIKQ